MKKLLVLLFVLLLVGLTAVQAQAPQISYYLAADANGVQQVYQLLLDGQSEARQITFAESDVLNFGTAYDGLSVAYIADGQLWLQPIHTEEAEALATLSATQFFSAPVYSADNQYIAYADNGLWLLDLGIRETRQLLEDVNVKPDGSNMAEMRLYQPEMFVLNAEGQAAQLVVDIGVWEWNTVGVYDLESGELQMLEGQMYTDLLPLSDGRVLLYGNSGLAGDFGLSIAESLDDINSYEQLVTFADLTDMTLYAQQALEIEPGVVRIIGETIGEIPHEPYAFTFDINVETGEAGDVAFIKLPVSDNTVKADVSSDGTLVPVYMGALWSDSGTIYGQLALVDITTGEAVDVELPETISAWRWQAR